jgi:mRNA-degrading endonuclease RelE of RelBE toxin-antitoxin system
MYNLIIREELDSKFDKLAKKNKKQLEIILNKVDEILENPHRYKNLKAPMNHLKRYILISISFSFFLLMKNKKP